MIRSAAFRNALSVALLALAIVGIATQVDLIRKGFVEPQARLTIAGYALVGIYAAVSLAVRLRMSKKP